MHNINRISFIEQARPHESGSKHVSGYANYIDDIIEPEGTLYGAIGLSKKAHAIIKKIDISKVKLSRGVISVVSHQDIPGRNDVGPVFDGSYSRMTVTTRGSENDVEQITKQILPF